MDLNVDQETIPFMDERTTNTVRSNIPESLLKNNSPVLLEMEDQNDPVDGGKFNSTDEKEKFFEGVIIQSVAPIMSLSNEGRNVIPATGHDRARDTVDVPLTLGDERKWNKAKNGDKIQLQESEHRRNSSFKFPLHAAAEKGNVQKLEKLLKTGDPLELDFKKKTPLHYACGFGYQKKATKMVEAILGCPLAQADSSRKKQLIDSQDYKGETGLHIAARTGHVKIVEKLIFSAADVNIPDKQGIEPLQLIYSKVPTALIPVYDGAIECLVGDRFDQNLTVRFDFGSIVGYFEEGQDTSFFKMESKLLSYCLQQSELKRSAILLHPIVQVFLFFKWKKIRVLLWISILFHVIWLIMYTLFITDLYLIKCPYKINAEEDEQERNLESSNGFFDDPVVHENSSETTGNVTMKGLNDAATCEIGKDILSSVNVKLSFLFAISISVAIKELYEIYSTPQLKFYFMQLENVGQWLLIGVIGLTSIPVFIRDDEKGIIFMYSWQYQACAFGIFLAWSLILSQIGKIPRFGTYIEMLGKVLRSFGMFMVTFASLLVAFTISFQILMPEKAEFQGFPWGFLKVLIMMIGEVNYDDVFYSEEAATQIPFPILTKLLFAAFVSIVTILLFNLLIGLTVSDIQGLKEVAQLTSLSSQLDQIYLMEKFIISKKVQQWLMTIHKHHWLRIFLVSQQVDDLDNNMAYDVPISKIPRHLQYQIREIATPNLKQEKDEDSDEDDNQNVVQNADSPVISNIGSTAELKELIRDVLREFRDELRNSNQN